VRVYVVAHVAIAFGAMRVLLRHWSILPTGPTIGAMAYAFGGPALFQYCNVVFLVGAAWMPLGLRCADRWVRLGDYHALGGLATAMALQTISGDPQAAYLVGRRALMDEILFQNDDLWPPSANPCQVPEQTKRDERF
jgi:hypothetical protein